MITFIDNGTGPDSTAVPRVWIKDLSHNHPFQITVGDSEAIRPAWSSHGNQIVFERQGKGIWSVPRQGGTARQIVEDGRHANVSPDGSRLVFVRGRKSGLPELMGVRKRGYWVFPSGIFRCKPGRRSHRTDIGSHFSMRKSDRLVTSG